MTPPPGFSISPQITNNTTSKRSHIITTVFVATTPENTPFAYRASTSTNPNHIISPAFVEANYEVLESLLRERRRQIHNEDLRTKLEYFSEDYDEEREMEPRPEPNREATPTLRPRFLVVHRQQERVTGFEEAPNREGSRRGRNVKGLDWSKYCHFHEEYGHDTNDYRQLRNQIEEAVKSGQLSHLVKGIKKEKVKASENQRTKWKKDKINTPAEAPILIIRQDESYTKNKFEGLTSESKEITFPSGGSNSSAPIVIKAKVFGREVNRVHMDSGSSCEKNSLGSIGKVPLEITIGDPPLTRKETLNFVFFKSESPYNMLLGRTVMQKMEIVVSTIHGPIKFHTIRGIGTVFSTHESDKVREGMKKGKIVGNFTYFEVDIGQNTNENNDGNMKDQSTQKLHRSEEYTIDTRSRSSTSRNEEICGNSANTYGTSTRGDSNDVPHSLDREHKVLQGAELNYPGMGKLILALVHAARRLRRYFQAHMITVLTNSPIKQTLTKPEKSGRVAKWEIELGEHDIVFQERGDKTLKDFLIEASLEDNEKKAEEKANTRSTKMKLSCEWKLFTDGAASSDSSGAGLMLIDPRGKEYNYSLHFRFETTNNKAEYEALLAGLQIS
ncbi:reverse transcriptase domain-containing protein [Tanacetum coccineum]